MNTKPVAFAMFRNGEYYDAIHPDEQAKTVGEYDIPLYTHSVKEQELLAEIEALNDKLMLTKQSLEIIERWVKK